MELKDIWTGVEAWKFGQEVCIFVYFVHVWYEIEKYFIISL